MEIHFTNLYNKELIIDKTKLKSKAHQKFATTNPETIVEVSSIKKAFITKVNNPKVRILRGNVKNNSSGFKTAFIIPKIKATIKAVVILSILIPDRKKAVIRTAKALIIQFLSKMIILFKYTFNF